VQVGAEKYWILSALISTVADKCKWANYQTLQTVFGGQLDRLDYEHPFCKRLGKLFAGDTFVEGKTGTGFVHIAPGHGLDDYNLGRQHDLPIYSPVDDDGRLCIVEPSEPNDLPIEQQMSADLVGKSILEKHGKSDANEAVLHELRIRHALLHQENYHHSYPYCWRSKTPIIFRAMNQWFIRIDHERPHPQFITVFRQQALVAINELKWIPDWGKNRIFAAIESRPDWCISRQRTWGVPIPAFYDAKGEPILDAQIVRNAADLIEKHGSNIWFEKSASELWLLVKPKDWNGAEAISKSNDTLDVWIDSGSSSRAVLKQRKELQHEKKSGDEVWQADVYLEGSDQHRGWFQSSLLLSLAGNNAVPFKKVLTHGFMVDADREKISKSKQGAYEKPQTAEAYVKKYGADVVRLWVASQDYRSDIVVSEERINKVGETYRGIRNALRYQLSNLYDFDPAKHSVPDEKLTGLDRWILGEFAKLEAEVLAAYDQYEFHVVYQKLSQFIAVELSSVYHDVIKDRLYTDAANSPRRRSTQTALHRLVTGLCQMLAPILAFTADEAWEFVPGKPTESVHESEFMLSGKFIVPEAEQLLWTEYLRMRDFTKPDLETTRQKKQIGKDLDASLVLTLPKGPLDLPDNIAINPAALMQKGREMTMFHVDTLRQIAKSPEELREILNVSRLQIKMNETSDDTFSFEVRHADGQKCERCWHWETDIGLNAEHPTICARCTKAILESKA
jgi:isoleucyl-tRNA synthetase